MTQAMSDAAAEERFSPAPRRLTTVVAADVCGYSRLAEIDDDAAIRTVNFVRAVFEQVVERRRGRLFHKAGDGFLAEFPSAADGVLAALEFVEDIKARDKLSPLNPGAQVRAGVHAGDVIDQPDGDLLGHGVNIAARLQGEAEPNGVLVSLAAVNLVRDSVGAQFSRRGPLALRNIEEPVVAFDAFRPGVSRNQYAHSALRVLKNFRKPAPAILALFIAAFAVVSGMEGARQPSGPAGALAAEHSSELADAEIALIEKAARHGDYVDQRYVRRVLTDLAASNRPSDAAVLALIAENNVEGAIRLLERQLTARTADMRPRKDLLHQISALSFERDPNRSIAAAEEILRIDPQDLDALIRRARGLAHQDRLVEAKDLFGAALLVKNSDPRISLELRIDIAAIEMHQYEMEAADERLQRIISEAEHEGYEGVVARAQTMLALVHFSNREFVDAKSYLVAAMARQRRLRLDGELARALNIMGQIEEELMGPVSALPFYKEQLDLETRLDSAAGVADALFFIGRAHLDAGEIDQAEDRFSDGARLSGAHNIADMKFLHLVGLADAANRREDQSAACRRIREAEEAYTGQSAIGPRTREVLTRIGCGFAPLKLASSAE